MIRASILSAFALNCSLAQATPTALHMMDGTWRGSELTLVLDTARMLANSDPSKPFQRDPLIIRNISGQMIVFAVGSRQFIGLFAGRKLTLTGDGVSGTAFLQRQ